MGQKRLRWRGTRLGILSGGLAGAPTGTSVVLFWGLWSVASRAIAGERLAASDPVTLDQAVANAVFNAAVFGTSAGAVCGAVLGAVTGYWTRVDHAEKSRIGVVLGATLLALLGIPMSPMGPWRVVVSAVGGLCIGAIGGILGDRLFAWMYRRGVGSKLERDGHT